MTTMTRESRHSTRKPTVSRDRKPGSGASDNVFADLFNMVEEIFGPDPQKTARK